MPVTMELRENGRVLYWVITDPWKVKDLIPLVRETRRLFDSARHKIHSLTNDIHTRQIPAGVLRLREVGPWSHPASGQLAVVGLPALGTALLDVIAPVTCFDRAKYFNTEEEAWAYLRQAIAEEDLPQQKDEETT